ncbi:MAG: NADPH-dependent FMN reductase [Phenylobacterium sp.]|uniref:NADPH-dependent FMN reductase n=1 Tax=Phenylobacterium sp. TaxID=1871053 RepID=UPI00273653D2|nr:NADPH-dependent FMN reductase [Phenylobacterium sp.]MDP3747376.1 NADPH-dependent FMN reductase [Phenylobacterium sp.]
MTNANGSPLVLGIGGALRSASSTEAALRLCLRQAERLGARVTAICGPDLDLPFYAPQRRERCDRAERLVKALKAADAVIIASPGYHGGVSGFVKNALDHIEDLRSDNRPYLDGLPIGCIATGGGWQGCVTTLYALRAVAHSARGWPTPLGVAINTAEVSFDPEGVCSSAAVEAQLDLLAAQVVSGVAGRPVAAQ